MSIRKHTKWIIPTVLGLIFLLTVLLYACSMIHWKSITSDFPVTIADAYFFASYGLGTFWPLLLLSGTVIYILYCPNKKRGGMLLASSLGLVSIPATFCGWVENFKVLRSESIALDFSSVDLPDTLKPEISLQQVSGFLPQVIIFTAVYLTVWLVLCPLVRKLCQRKCCQPDIDRKKRSHRKALQATGGVIAILSALCLLLFAFSALPNVRVPGIEPHRNWYISIWVHCISGILAGVELIVGLKLFLDRSCGKVPVGALLLGSSFMNLFCLGYCYPLIVSYVNTSGRNVVLTYGQSVFLNLGFGDHYALTESMLFVILHRIVSAVVIGVALLWFNKKNKTAAVNSSKKATSGTAQHSKGT